jgi:hypothetical protein
MTNHQFPPIHKKCICERCKKTFWSYWKERFCDLCRDLVATNY